jgi:phthiocerol/phenolphthiocerol synthesis type-I polyketide synthase D
MKPKAPELGIMFFSASEESLLVDKYRLVLEAARFADAHGFSSVWVPERHFATLGGLYPNPSVLQAAVAAVTERVALRAGSVVLPLHDPVRVAEEWSMVDNLSGGRVGVSFASGWNPADFIFFPERYANRHDELFAAVPVVQRLWRGETVVGRGGDGREVPVRILPRPVQQELPIWITAARSPETFVRAGEIGANVLTHLLDQDIAGIAEKVALYREARARKGLAPSGGVVTVMVHTFVGADAHAAIETARRPYCEFLKSNASLLQGLAASRRASVDIDAISEQERDVFVNFLYDRFVGSRALIGSPATCRDLIMQLWAAGVDEIACLLDFGPAYDAVLDNLPYLDELRQLCVNAAMDDSKTRGRAGAVSPAPRTSWLETVQARCAPAIEATAFYDGMERRGLKIEGDVRAVQRVWRRDGEALGAVEIAARADSATTAIAPALLDACLQIAIAAAPRSAGQLHVPAGFRSLEVIATPGLRAWSHAVIRSEGAAGLEADVRILDHDGGHAASVTGLRLRRTEMRPRQIVGPWLYRLDWQRCAPPDGDLSPSGSWLILADRGGVGAELAAHLREVGSTSIVIDRDMVFGADAADRGDGESLERLASALGGAYAHDAGFAGVVHLWSLDTASPHETTRRSLENAESWGSAAALVVIQSLLVPHGAKPPRLWLVTRGAHAIGTEAAPVAFAQAPLWGLGKTCAMEHPEIWGGLIDLDPAVDASASARSVARALAASDGEDQVAFRNGARHVARLVHADPPEAPPFEVHGDGSYLVTGGLWGLGLEVARWLVDKGARHLVVLGRTDLPPRETWGDLDPEGDVGVRVAAVRDLEALGAVVRYAAVDVADAEGVTSLVGALARDGNPRVRGVVHTASVWRDPDGQSLIRTLGQLDVFALRRVFAPKVIGTWALHEAFRDTPLDIFLLFSSAASLTGSAGQGNYAAASSFLDGIAHYRQQTGRSALSVNWGPVSGSGFGTTPDGLKVHRYWEDNGLKRIAPADVLSALELLIPSGVPSLGVMNVDWKQLGAFFPALARSRWASDLVPASTPRPDATGFLFELRAAPAGTRRELLRKHVQHEVRRVMGLERLPDPRRRLFDMGMDSLMALDIKKRLQEQLAADISVTAVFNYPTIDALVGYLAGDVLHLESEGAIATTVAIDEADPLARIKELTDDEAERRLAERAAAKDIQS